MLKIVQSNIKQFAAVPEGNWNTSNYTYDDSTYNPDSFYSTPFNQVCDTFLEVCALQQYTDANLGSIGGVNNGNGVQNVDMNGMGTAKKCLNNGYSCTKGIVSRLSNTVNAMYAFEADRLLAAGIPVDKNVNYAELLYNLSKEHGSDILNGNMGDVTSEYYGELLKAMAEEKGVKLDDSMYEELNTLIQSIIAAVPDVIVGGDGTLANVGAHNVAPVLALLLSTASSYATYQIQNPDSNYIDFLGQNYQEIMANAGVSAMQVAASSWDIPENPVVELIVDSCMILAPKIISGEKVGEAVLESTVFAVAQNGLEIFGKAGSTWAATKLSEASTKPFVGEDGEVSQGWCLAAGAATLGGAIFGSTAAGVAITSTVAAGAATVIGAGAAATAVGVAVAAAPALLVGAAVGAVGYGLVVGARAISNWWNNR